jgi:alkylation response protein AidB-like acyl-CoA dehydrogenase
MATAGFERGVSLRSPARYTATADRLVDLWRRRADPDDDVLREAVADAWMAAEAYRLHTYRTVTRLVEGGEIGAEASLNKIHWSELDIRLHTLAQQLLGPDAERADGEAGRWLDGFLFSLAGPIYAGTNEIQRNVVAERVLGLPRGR